MKTAMPILTTLILTMLAGNAPAGEPEVKGALADRSSKPGPHLEKIKALGDNAWVNLGRPAPDPKYGAAQGRSWSRKMAFAPDQRGAFIYGENSHGAASVRGGKRYYNDDLYFYDINANSWVCCHPGTPLDPPGPGLKFDDATGLETDKDGNILPVAVSVHAYWAVDYDTPTVRCSCSCPRRPRCSGRSSWASTAAI